MNIIDGKKIDISNDEFNYYKEIVKTLTINNINGEDYFKDLIEVDKEGFIMLIKPNKSIPWAVLFFVQQLQINQRLRIIDKFRLENKMRK